MCFQIRKFFSACKLEVASEICFIFFQQLKFTSLFNRELIYYEELNDVFPIWDSSIDKHPSELISSTWQLAECLQSKKEGGTIISFKI